MNDEYNLTIYDLEFDKLYRDNDRTGRKANGNLVRINKDHVLEYFDEDTNKWQLYTVFQNIRFKRSSSTYIHVYWIRVSEDIHDNDEIYKEQRIMTKLSWEEYCKKYNVDSIGKLIDSKELDEEEED
jgi:hypothetical protein